jgi:hypothetical protein
MNIVGGLEMELSIKELYVLLTLLEREKDTQGLSPTEEEIVKKLETKYKELGGYVRED